MSLDEIAGAERHGPPSRRLAARSSRRRYLLAGVSMLLAVVAGVVIGAGGAVIFLDSHKFKRPEPQELADRITGRMAKVLRISPEELRKIDSIVVAHMQEVRRIRKEMFGRIRGQFGAMVADMDAVLGPERAAEWSKDYKERTGRDRYQSSRNDQRKDDE